jgi:pilus assembly protein Flp/PilA
MKFLNGRLRGRRELNARGDRGATAVEYAIMVSFIAVVIAVAVTAFGVSVRGLFEFIVASRPFG